MAWRPINIKHGLCKIARSLRYAAIDGQPLRAFQVRISASMSGVPEGCGKGFVGRHTQGFGYCRNPVIISPMQKDIQKFAEEFKLHTKLLDDKKVIEKVIISIQEKIRILGEERVLLIEERKKRKEIKEGK